MILLITASILLLTAPDAWSAPELSSLPAATSTAISNKPAPQLLALEHRLRTQQEAQKAGVLPAPQYQAFIAQFRTDLDAVMVGLPPAPANTALYALILSHLGERGSAQALATLRQAREATPNDSVLLRAESEIHRELKDYPAAASAALKAWEASGHSDNAAWALYQLSKDRVAPRGTNVKSVDLPRSVTDGGTAAKPEPATIVAKSLLGNLPTPPAPGETTSEATGNSPGDAATVALAAAATATGGILLFLGLGGRALEEKLPGIRRKLGIAATVGGVIALSMVSIPRLAPLMFGNPAVTERARNSIAAAESPQAQRLLVQTETQLPNSVRQSALLKEHLRQLQKYGAEGYRELENGAIRYYEQIKPADKVGRMIGARRVREWNPATGVTRTWFETVDEAGAIRLVRPETGGPKVHYYFNEAGDYIGTK